MIKVTYDIQLTEIQFKALKAMVKNHFKNVNHCSVEESNLYDMFKIDEEPAEVGDM